MTRLRRYSAREFDRGAAISRLENENIELARAVLVDGRRQNEVAKDAGVVRQRVNQLVKKMVQYIEEANPVPRGWKTDTVTLPLNVWPKVRELEREAQEALTKQQQEKRR